jgi:L-threonylcarbamoyladenylate synthase
VANGSWPVVIVKDKKSILKIAKALKRGAVIVYPTDTAYGLGCDATNAKAVARIFKMKGRCAAKGLPLIVSDVEMAKRFFFLATRHAPLAARHWPGPLSIVLKSKKGIAKAALEKGTAAVRVPASDIARRISQALGLPLVATSANLSGASPCYSAKAYLKQVYPSPYPLPVGGEGVKIPSPARGREGRRPGEGGRLPDIILDAGALPHRRPSTIVRFGKRGKMEILRRGPVRL